MNASGQSQSTDPRVASYLDALNRALYGLPDAVRAEVYGEIRQHIDDELAGRPGDSAAIPEVLERLGDPLEIAREAGAYPQQPPQPTQRGRAHEIAAVILLAVGGFIGGIGWLVGLVLLWTSERFTRADKIIGTILVPGGFLASLVVLGVGAVAPVSQASCSSGPVEVPVQSGGGHGGLPIHSTLTAATCTGGPSTAVTIVIIAVLLVVVLGPLYTTIRLSRRVAAM